MIEVNKIYHGDCKKVMATFPDDCIDLTVTSPPYDNLREYNGYVFDFEGIAQQLYRVTKPGGVVVWVVGDATIDGSETGTSFKQALYFMTLGFNLHDTMIYQKANPIPLTHNRYEQSFEYMFVFCKGKLAVFNPIKEPVLSCGKLTHRTNTAKSGEAATRNRDQWTKGKKEKYLNNVFSYVAGRKSGTKTHPAPFPERLAQDHIISWSNKGDIVLDHFAGSGTTCKMAKENHRKFIGIEISEEYLPIIENRIKNAEPSLF